MIKMKKPEYYSVRSFENLDPLEVDHGYLLVARGNRKLSVAHECSVKAIKVEGDTIEITMERDYDLSHTPDDSPLIPMGARITLRFEEAIVKPNPVNEPEDKFTNITVINDLTPIELAEDEKAQGYNLGLEVNGWEDGRWNIYYKTVRAIPEPTERDVADMEQLKQSVMQMKSEIPPEIVEAHEHSSHNKEEIQRSKLCGCFSCLRIFKPSEITQWGYVMNPKDFAVCPYCEIDSVIGDASGYPVTEEFLKSMHKYWF